MKLLKYFSFGFVLLLLSTFGYMKWNNYNYNDLALNLFALVKKWKGETVDWQNIGSGESAVVDHQIWSELLAKHVTTVGQVDYKGFLQDRKIFEQYLAMLRTQAPGSNWTTPQQLAYWINAYNAFTIQLILDHYPLKSIKDISEGLPMINSPWDIKFFTIGGIEFDLNTIEHEILRKQFAEPRIHFAINCASFSCPQLRNEAFVAERLDQQLDEQTRAFINNPDKNTITASTTEISKIFHWFASDFLKQSSIPHFLQKYHAEINTANKIDYLEYNWALNE